MRNKLVFPRGLKLQRSQRERISRLLSESDFDIVALNPRATIFPFMEVGHPRGYTKIKDVYLTPVREFQEYVLVSDGHEIKFEQGGLAYEAATMNSSLYLHNNHRDEITLGVLTSDSGGRIRHNYLTIMLPWEKVRNIAPHLDDHKGLRLR